MLSRILTRGKPSHEVQIVSSTWARDRHNLFDFEANGLHTKTLTGSRSMQVVRTGTDVHMVGLHEPLPPNCDHLFNLVDRDGTFFVDRASPDVPPPQYVVHDSFGQRRLTEGDIIKLGCFKLKVRQMVASESSGTQTERTNISEITDDELKLQLQQFVAARVSSEVKIKEHDVRQVRDTLTPFLNKEELGKQINRLLQAGTRFLETSRQNRHCLAERFMGTLAQALTSSSSQAPPTKAPFIALENMTSDLNGEGRGRMHVISLADYKVLTLGRSRQNDVCIADVSVSRSHANISFHDGQFVLKDDNSQFGTLIAMKKPRALTPGESISIQVGRTVLILRIKKADTRGRSSAIDVVLVRLRIFLEVYFSQCC